MDFVSVVLIEAAVEGEEGDPIHLHVNFEVTAAGSEDAASALLDELIAQADDPNSRLLQGSVTASVEHVGEARGNLNPGCEPVFLGPDIGFVNIMVRTPRCCRRAALSATCLRHRSTTMKMARAPSAWLSSPPPALRSSRSAWRSSTPAAGETPVSAGRNGRTCFQTPSNQRLVCKPKPTCRFTPWHRLPLRFAKHFEENKEESGYMIC